MTELLEKVRVDPYVIESNELATLANFVRGKRRPEGRPEELLLAICLIRAPPPRFLALARARALVFALRGCGPAAHAR